MGTAERRQRERENKHQAIIDAAVELFLREGYEQTSIRKIAKKIEYTPGAVYSYFKDKDEILYEIHKRGFTKLFEIMQQGMAEPSSIERLHKTGQLYLKFAQENTAYYDLMFIERCTSRVIEENKSWESGQRAHDALVQMVTDCIEDGYFPGADPRAVAHGVWSLVHGLASLLIRDRCLVLLPDCPNLVDLAYEFVWSQLIAVRR